MVSDFFFIFQFLFSLATFIARIARYLVFGAQVVAKAWYTSWSFSEILSLAECLILYSAFIDISQ